MHLIFIQASAYLKQGKYKEAEQLYREVLTAASEKDKPDESQLLTSNPANLNKVIDIFFMSQLKLFNFPNDLTTKRLSKKIMSFKAVGTKHPKSIRNN